jgi:hypothetical protein
VEHIAEQVHGKFKVFAGPLNADDAIGPPADEISGFDELERKMTEASERFSNIICQELYVTGGHDFMMIFMTHEQ